MTHPAGPPRLDRADAPEVAALRRLKVAQPDLAGAVDLQVDLLVLYRRVQTRISTPWLDTKPEDVASRLRQGLPLLACSDVAFDWAELRSLVRQIADLMKRFDILEPPDYQAIQQSVRAGHPNQADVTDWFSARLAKRVPGACAVPETDSMPEAMSQTLALATRPFLVRAVGVVQQQIDLSTWFRPYCPFCCGDAELAVLTTDGTLRLVCGTCTASWPFDEITCPHCDSRDTTRRTTLESRDGRYRLVACDVCQRYLKVYLARGADRPVLLDVDTIATLPLDAVAAQRGYVS